MGELRPTPPSSNTHYNKCLLDLAKKKKKKKKKKKIKKIFFFLNVFG